MPDVLRVILRLVGARSLNSLGRAVISATVLWELWERTQSALVLSAVGLVQVIPVFVLFVPSGALVDRSDRRSLTALAAGGTGLVGVGLAIASFTDAPVAVFLALLCAQGCMTAIHSPGASSLMPLVLPRESLERANRINASFGEMAQIGGPALAGVALHFIDASAIYAFVAVTGIAAGALYRSLPAPRAVEGAANARRDWRVGLRFIFSSPLLLPALTLDMFAVLFAGATALLPMVSTQLLHVGALGYGVLRAAQSAGAVMMAIIGGRLPAWRRPGRVLLYVVALFGLATVAFGFSHSFVLSVVLLVAMGALDNISVVIRLTLEQMVVPDAIRGRVSAVHYVFIGMSNELGAAESGLAADLFGLVGAIAGGGALAVIVVGVVAFHWRALAAMPPLTELKPADER
ncbi:MAG TPA: MFS transporter [Kofleriaceae bacterium]